MKKIYSLLGLTLLYGLAFWLLHFFLVRIQLFSFLPNNITLSRWDASIYYRAAQEGYYATAEYVDNTGVFILFPYVWKLLHVDYVGMAIANFIIYAIAVSILLSQMKVSKTEQLIWLSTPSLYFFMVPYSEAVFFMVSTLVVISMIHNYRALCYISLFLLCFCRPTASFLLPAYFLAELLSNPKSKILSSIFSYLYRYALPIIVGTAGFTLLQYAYTGKWFAYYHRQVKYLGHKLAIPTFPLSDFYGGYRMLWLCGFSLSICFLAMMLLFREIYRWIKQNDYTVDKLWVLSLGYLTIIMLTMIFANPTWGSNTTNLLGMHRYTFCSPFFFLFLNHLTEKEKLTNNKSIIAIAVIFNIALLMMGSYLHIKELLYFNSGTILFVCYLLYKQHPQKYNTLAVALFGINLLIQAYFFQSYLQGYFTE